MNRQTILVAVQALVTVALLVALLRGLDLVAFRALFARLPLWYYVLSLAVVLLGQVAYAWRWQLLLVAAGVRVPFRVVVRQYFIGIFVNNFLPSTVGGDLAKVYLLGRDHGYREVTASVLLDRILGVGLLAFLAALTLWTLPMPSPMHVAARGAVSAIALCAVIVLAIAAVGTGGLAERLGGMGPRVVRFALRLQRLRFAMAAGLTSPRVVSQAGAVVIGYFLALAWIYVLFVAMHEGAAPSFAMILGVVMSTSVLSNIPVSLNGLGLREQLHALLLAPLGVSREVAVAISLLLFGHMVVASLLGFLFWLQAPALPSDTAERVQA